MPLGSTEKLILVAVLAVIMLFVVFFELRVIRSKGKEIRRASQRKDEAYNSILTTRSVINVMQRQGHDVAEANRLLDRAKLAMQRGDYDGCMDLAQKSREELTVPGKAARGAAEAASEDETEDGEKLEEVASSILSADKVREAETYSGSKLSGGRDGNYLSAKFEINTAKADIGKAVDRGDDTVAAQDLVKQAESAFGTGDYTKALSCAVKARKAVNARAQEDTISLDRATEAQEPRTDVQEAPKEAGVWECDSCGAGLDEEDAFCHKCGAKVEKEKTCSVCGTKPRPSDMFCRKCGAKV